MADIFTGQLTLDDKDWSAVERDGQKLPASGKSVQDLIITEFENKGTYIYNVEDVTYSTLLGFKDKIDYEEWVMKFANNPKDGLTSDLILSRTQIAKAEPEDRYTVQIFNDYKSDKFVSIDGIVKIPFHYTYTYTTYNNGIPTVDDQLNDYGKIIVEAKQSGDWENARKQEYDVISFTQTDLDLSQLINSGGMWTIRAKAVASNPEHESGWKTLSVIKSNITLNLKTNWALPQTPSSNNNITSLKLSFECTGDYVDKKIHVEVSGVGGSTPTGVVKNVGSGNFNDFITILKTNTYNIGKHGIHTVKYWVSIDGIEDKILEQTTNIMINTDQYDNNAYIIVNNIKGQNINDPIPNWTNQHLFDCAVFDPSGNDEYRLNIVFKNNEGNIISQAVENLSQGEIWNVSQDLSIDGSDEIMSINIYWVQEDSSESKISTLYISNVGDYSPSSGAIFSINVKNRSNDESEIDRKKIYNNSDNSTEIQNVIWENVSFNDTDGWIKDNNGYKCLRILDGQSVTIPYQPFKINDVNVNCSIIEMTLAVRNIVDETKPLIRICNYTEEDGVELLNGFELRGSDAYLLPNLKKEQDILDLHDIMFQEDERMHLAICVNKQEKKAGEKIRAKVPFKPSNSDKISEDMQKQTFEDIDGYSYHYTTLSKDSNFIRIYINGVLSRIVEFDAFDWDNDSLKRFIIFGNSDKSKIGADLDIYDFKVFHTFERKPDYQILKDYIASLPTTTEKDITINRNNILAYNENLPIIRDGEIDYNTAISNGYNVLVWKYNDKNSFVRPSGREFGDPDKKTNQLNKGDLEINIFKTDVDGTRVLDKSKSGVLTNLKNEGQGTTAMLYFKANQRFKMTDDSIFKALDGTELSQRYRLNDNDPWIERLDGKINWASSMQSHKMGSVSLYHDCWSQIVGGSGLTKLNSVSEFEKLDLEKMGSKYTTPTEAFNNACEFTGNNNGYGSCRVAVRQEPFLFFVLPYEGFNNNTPQFYSQMTWGASKGDNPTFGYNEDFNPYFVMIEGSDNFRDLIECKIPWNDPHIYQQFKDGEVDDPIIYEYKTYSETGEAQVKADKQFEISMGDPSESVVGSKWSNGTNPCLKMFTDMINYIFLHNPNMQRYDGNYEKLNSDSNADKSLFYWTSANGDNTSKYDVFRYDLNVHQWVPAGLYDEATSTYKTRNLLSQLNITENDVITENDIISTYNEWFIEKLTHAFRDGYKTSKNHAYGWDELYENGIGEYVHIKDLQYILQFLKLIAGTDNWAKNTYIYNTGIYYKKVDGKYLGGSEKYEGLDKFAFFQDDLDTIFEIDNYGAKTKPYYVEEHDYITKADGSKDQYWNSHNNAMYYLPEMAYGIYDNSKSLNNMMSNILSVMGSNGFESYYQNKAQNYYPETIYNKVSDMLYVDGYYRGAGLAPSRYERFLSQCLGGQLSAEREWQKKRLAYMSSYAQYGVFGTGTGGSGIGFKPTGSITLSLTPHIWLYPRASEGSSDITIGEKFENSFNVPGRVAAGQTFNLTIASVEGSENNVTLKGHNYYRDLGNLARIQPEGSKFNISGQRLSSLNVIGSANNKIIFNPSSFGIAPGANVNNMRNIIIKGPSQIDKIMDISSVDLSPLWRLDYLDLSATSIKEVKLAPNSNIKTLILPKSTKVLNLIDLKKLESFELPSYKSLETLVIKNPSNYIKSQTLNIFGKCVEQNAPLKKLNLTDINWKLSKEQFEYLINIESLSLTGIIDITGSFDLDFTTKMKLIDKFGNIDDVNNDLYIIYEKFGNIENGFNIRGASYIYNSGSYKYTCDINSNIFKSIRWDISGNPYATINEISGELICSDVDENLMEMATITCSIEVPSLVTEGAWVTKTSSKDIYFYQKDLEVGDYLYADGTYGLPADDYGDKDIVAICFQVNEDKRSGLGVSVEFAYDNAVEWGCSNTSSYTSWHNVGYSVGDYSSTGIITSDNGKGLDFYISTKSAKKVGDGSYTDCALADYGLKTLGYNMTTEAINLNEREKLPTYNASDKLPTGLINTLGIIEHRNEQVIKAGKASGLMIPGKGDGYYEETTIYNEMSDLISLIEKNDGKDESYYYPAASLCYAYVPNYDNLDSKFSRRRWFLPSAGELAKIWYYINMNAETREWIGFDKISDYMKSVAKNGELKIWSSTENSYNKAYSIHFNPSNFGSTSENYFRGSKNDATDYKNDPKYVLPIVMI